MPGCEVPMKIDNLLEDEDAAKQFAQNAGKIVQR